MRIVFLGTPEFACPSLRALVDAGHELPLVVSQPDKVRGRRQKPQPTPVRALAQELELPNTTLERGGRDALYRRILDLEPDAAVVVAFGHIIREPLLRGPRLGCINVHASLLPRWRGPAPIHRAIVAGDAETGVGIMALEEGVDTGPVFLSRSTPIGPDETTADLHDRLAALGAEALVETLAGLAAGTLEAEEQDPEAATHAPLLRREEGSVDFAASARRVHDRIRGLFPWPAVTVLHGGRRLKLLSTSVDPAASGQPGEVLEVDAEGFLVACGEGGIRLRRVQPEARAAMDAADYVRGYDLTPGTVLTPLPGFRP